LAESSSFHSLAKLFRILVFIPLTLIPLTKRLPEVFVLSRISRVSRFQLQNLGGDSRGAGLSQEAPALPEGKKFHSRFGPGDLSLGLDCMPHRQNNR